MSLLNAGATQLRIWDALRNLGAPDALRDRSIAALVAAGPASMPYLRQAVGWTGSPRVQYGAAIALHRLGGDGLAVVIDALHFRLPVLPAIAPEVESALVRIGAPDAVTELIKLWRQSSDLPPNSPVLHTICRVWAHLRDPRALDALSERAVEIPSLFLDTAPAFGEIGVRHLARMARTPPQVRRLLAVQALAKITLPSSAEALEPLLVDPYAEIREAAAAAVESAGGTAVACAAISAAVRSGFSSRKGVQILVRNYRPDTDEILRELVVRWRSNPPGDTPGAVAVAIAALPHSHLSRERILNDVIPLITPHSGADIEIAAAHCIGAVAGGDTLKREIGVGALEPLLCSPEDDVRAAAAAAMDKLGDSFGVRFLGSLEKHRNGGKVLPRLLAGVRGQADPTHMASETVQAISKWIGDMSKTGIARMVSAGMPDANAAAANDTRFDQALTRLLHASLDRLAGPVPTSRAPELAALCEGALRACARISPEALQSMQPEIYRALGVSRIVRNAAGDERDAAAAVRAVAVEILLQQYPESRFPLLLQAVFELSDAGRITAIAALGALAEARALPVLRILATGPPGPVASAAESAIAALRKRNPEMMTLLRGSSAHTPSGKLLRAASGNRDTGSPDLLLRPGAKHSAPAP